MATAAPIIGSGQIGELFRDAILRNIKTIAQNRAVAWNVVRARARRATEKVHAVADARGEIVSAADYAQRDVRHIVIRAPAVGKTGRVAGQAAEPLLIFRL